MKIWVFDLDGTLCSQAENYEDAVPIEAAIKKVNELYEQGNEIIIHTARGSLTGIDWRARTEAQLVTWGVRYHRLVFGKPAADYYVDDRAVNVEDWLK